MDLKAHAKYALQRGRWFTEQILDSLNGDDWFFQAGPKVNYPLWIVGHLGLADNAFLGRFRPDQKTKPDGWDELFWFGSELKDRGAYPPVEEVLAYFRERRQALLGVIDELSEEDLSAAPPPADAMDPIAGAPCVGHILLFAASHESMHTGQLTVTHRALGHSPVIGT